jgi:Ca2+-binding EF-hand superfamily protein
MRNAALLGAGLTLAICTAALAQTGSQSSGQSSGQPAARTATKAEMAERRHAMFAKLDRNGDGKITKDEADQAKADMRERKLDRMFARLDANKDGQISRTEAEQVMDRRGEGAGARMGRHDLLARLDKDGDGAITQAEFDAAGDARFARLDRNGDGVISPDERPMRHGRRHEGGPR